MKRRSLPLFISTIFVAAIFMSGVALEASGQDISRYCGVWANADSELVQTESIHMPLSVMATM